MTKGNKPENFQNFKIPKLMTAAPPRFDFYCLLQLLNSSTEQEFISKCPRGLRESATGPIAWSLRDEILEDLEQLVEPSTSKSGERALNHIVNKVSMMGLRLWWIIAPSTRTWFDSDDKKEKNNVFWPRLGTEQGIVKIGRKKFIVAMIFSHFCVCESRKFFYGIIINALQNGAFEYLCRCKWRECRHFFVTTDLREKSFCKPQCKKAAKTFDSRQRMDAWRSKQENN